MAGKKPVLSPISVAAPQSRSAIDLFDGLLEHARTAAGISETQQAAEQIEAGTAERFHWLLLNRLELAPEQRDRANELIERAVAGDGEAEREMRQLIATQTQQPTVSPLGH